MITDLQQPVYPDELKRAHCRAQHRGVFALPAGPGRCPRRLQHTIDQSDAQVDPQFLALSTVINACAVRCHRADIRIVAWGTLQRTLRTVHRMQPALSMRTHHFHAAMKLIIRFLTCSAGMSSSSDAVEIRSSQNQKPRKYFGFAADVQNCRHESPLWFRRLALGNSISNVEGACQQKFSTLTNCVHKLLRCFRSCTAATPAAITDQPRNYPNVTVACMRRCWDSEDCTHSQEYHSRQGAPARMQTAPGTAMPGP